MSDVPVQGQVPDATMDQRRRNAMRRIAACSFAYMVAQGGAVTVFVLLSPERAAIATVIEGLTPLIIATNAMFSAVVLSYMGVAATEKYLTGKS